MMKTPLGFLSAATLAAAILAAPRALAAGPTHDDVFMRKAMQGNLAEIKEGQLAERKGATAGVRRLGAVLVQDHSTANEKAMAAASRMGVTPPAEPNPKQQAEYQRLASLSGARFDRTFVKSEIKDHKQTIAKFKKEAKAPTNSPATTYASTSLPVLDKHLRLAETLERRPGG